MFPSSQNLTSFWVINWFNLFLQDSIKLKSFSHYENFLKIERIDNPMRRDNPKMQEQLSMVPVVGHLKMYRSAKSQVLSLWGRFSVGASENGASLNST